MPSPIYFKDTREFDQTIVVKVVSEAQMVTVTGEVVPLVYINSVLLI